MSVSGQQKLTLPLTLLFFYDSYLHFNPVVGVIPFIPRLADNVVGHLHSGHNLPEGCVLLIQKWGIGYANEKLGTGAIWICRPGHGKGPPLMGLFIKLRLDRVPGTAHPMLGAIGIFGVGISPLNHKPRDCPVENRPIIKALFDQLDKIVHMIRRYIGKKF